jgi:hypothetical protein
MMCNDKSLFVLRTIRTPRLNCVDTKLGYLGLKCAVHTVTTRVETFNRNKKGGDFAVNPPPVFLVSTCQPSDTTHTLSLSLLSLSVSPLSLLLQLQNSEKVEGEIRDKQSAWCYEGHFIQLATYWLAHVTAKIADCVVGSKELCSW